MAPVLSGRLISVGYHDDGPLRLSQALRRLFQRSCPPKEKFETDEAISGDRTLGIRSHRNPWTIVEDDSW